MADIRIKDLTTTASSTASDDFIAVDGTTNGTRKLNAFSPTFGGNATVTGTLTANSTSSFADRITLRKDVAGNVEQLIDNRNTAGGEVIYLSEDGLSTEYAYIARYNSAHATTSKRKALEFGVNGTGAFYNFASGVLKVSDTTASTTTSTGALVVGNGTSGGLGVGGDANIGGSLTVTGASNGIICNGAGLSLNTAGSASVRFQDAGVSKWWIYKLSGDPWLYFRDMVNGRMQLQMVPGATSSTAISTFNSNLEVTSTSASTSTSSGALVVSGGVGVAGAIFAGGNIQCNAVYASNNTTLYLRPQGATVSSGEAQLTTTGNLTLNGSVQTSAPSGGTAAAWKLGTVATVSPTSPNRTIEVDIGGTIYYIHAKTTNN